MHTKHSSNSKGRRRSRRRPRPGQWLRLGNNLVRLAIVAAVLAAVLVVVAAVGGLLAGFSVFDDDYRLDVATVDVPVDEMRITNRTAFPIRIHAFDATDGAKIIARENVVVEPGATVGLDPVPSVFHLWKSQLFDASLTWTRPLFSDVVISGSENNLQVAGETPDTMFVNDVDEHVKVCVHQVGDIGPIPLRCWTLGPDQEAPIVWSEPPAAFKVMVYDPAILDEPLTVHERIPARSTVTITKRSGFLFW